MKRKLFCLLTLLLAVCSGAWATDEVVIIGAQTKLSAYSVAKNTHSVAGYSADDPNSGTITAASDGQTASSGSKTSKTSNIGSALASKGHVRFTVSAGETVRFYYYQTSGSNKTTTFATSDFSQSSSYTHSPANYIAAAKNTLYFIDFEFANAGTYAISQTDGQSVYIAALKFTAAVPAALSIKTNPVSAIYSQNESATALSVVAQGGTKPYTYQWYSCTDAEKSSPTALTSDDEIAKGSQTASYTPSTAATGYYFCKVTDAASAVVESDVATITVSAASAPTKPAISGGPAEAVAKNTAVTLTASSTGLPSPTYQWYSNTTAVATVDEEHKIDGATEASYSPSTAAIGTKYYYVVASNSEGSATSDVFSVEVVGSNACELTRVLYSNGFDAFIKLGVSNNTITAYYLEGATAPTISSVTVSEGATWSVEGTTLTVTAEDGTTTKDFTISVASVAPYTGDGINSFEGTETWIKTGYSFSAGDKYWRFSKSVEESSNHRVTEGQNRLYLFVGPSTKITLTSSATSRNIKVYKNGSLLDSPTNSGAADATRDIAGDEDNAYMIAIVSNQTGGDGGFKAITVTKPSVKYDINFAAMTNGSVTASPSPAVAGATVTLTVSPADGYELNSLTVTGDTSSDEVTITDNQFTMPAENVTVAATFSEVVVPVSDEVTFDLRNSSFVVSGAGTTQDGINFKSTGDPTKDYLNFGESSGGQTITIAGTGNKRISQVVLTYTDTGTDRTGGGDALTVSPNDEGYSLSSKVGTWTSANAAGDASVTFTTASKARVESVVVTYVEVVAVTGNAYNWITFCNGSALDFTGSDVTAYVVTGTSETALEKTEVGAVAAGTPLMINATEGTHYVKKAATGTDYSATNCLKQGEDAAVDAVGGKSRYILTLRNKKAAFAIIDNEYSPTVPSDKAYLEIEDGGAGAARSFFFLDDEGETTSLNEVRGLKAEVRGDFYDLSGRKVAQPTKGLYIVNGRKVVIK